MLIAGLMTGTSLDGIDVAICDISNSEGRPKCELLAFDMLDYPAGFADYVRSVICTPNWEDISFLHFALPKLYAEAIRKVADENKIELSKIELIGMHGQTIWHSPVPKTRYGVTTGSTMQLGDGSVLAKLLGIPVVSDFRSGDVALGGQGAPLVPRFDDDFFSDDLHDVVCLNIGGMANITYIPAGKFRDKKTDTGNCWAAVIAFDTGPGNILINTAIKKYFGKEYDEDGAIATSALVNNNLLNALMQDTYVNAAPPKSTGREYFNEVFLTEKLNMAGGLEVLNPCDIIATLTRFTAESIAFNIRKFAKVPGVLYVSGGGARNKTILQMLHELLPEAEIKLPDELGIPSDAKEAIAFAYLAWLTKNHISGNLPSVTGASADTVLGSISE